MKRLIRRHALTIAVAVLSAIVCSALYAGWAQERRAFAEYREHMTQRLNDDRQVSQAAIYGLSYALSSEQEKAGEFEGERDDRVERLSACRGYIRNLRSQIKRLADTNTRQTNLIEQLQSDNWTGNTRLKSKKEDE